MFNRWRAQSLKKRIGLTAATGGLITLIYVSVAFLTVRPAEVRLAELKNSWEQEKICHESCAFWRRAATEEITRALAADSDLRSRAARQLKLYLLDEEISVEFRAELIKILRQATGLNKPPAYLQDYLFNGDNAAVRAAIIDSYGLEPLDKLFTLLNGHDDLAVRQAAVRALSNYPAKETGFSAGQLKAITELILNPETERRLRQDLVMLLSDYYPLWSTETAAILLAIYEHKEIGDEVSRAFAVDIYNRFNGGLSELPLPLVSDAAWDEYFNN